MKRVALVTGVLGGIGRALADAFLLEGWSVIGIDRADAPPPDAIAYVRADLRDPAQIARAVEGVRASAGRLDALVNNAAVQLVRSFRETTVDDWEATMAVNVRAAFFLSQAAVELLAAARGSIVNISSAHALATSRGLAAYAASKGALAALTRAMAVELAPLGVRANAVVPGAIDTPMLRMGLTRAESRSVDPVAALGARTVLGRVGSPEDIAHAVTFLADPDRAAFITGQLLIVDGGALARLSTEPY